VNLPVNYNEIHFSERKLVREEYTRIQAGKCHYCKQQLSVRPSENKRVNKNLFPKKFFDWPVHLHHDHKTGMTIGAVHAYCNAVLWQYHGE
jgi:hypothetical protein